MKVIDANVIIHGRGFSEKALTVREVVEEIKSSQASRKLESVDLEIRKPSKKFLEEVKQKEREVNADVSDVDVKLLALAIERDSTLLTDDKELQNLGLHLGADVSGFLDDRTDKIVSWKFVCPNCGRKPCDCGAEKVRVVDSEQTV